MLLKAASSYGFIWYQDNLKIKLWEEVMILFSTYLYFKQIRNSNILQYFTYIRQNLFYKVFHTNLDSARYNARYSNHYSINRH